MDLVGEDLSPSDEMKRREKIAGRRQREISEQLSAIRGASTHPEQARKLGVDVKDPVAVKAKVQELRQLQERWKDWHKFEDLVAEVVGVRTEEGVQEILPGAEGTVAFAGERGFPETTPTPVAPTPAGVPLDPVKASEIVANLQNTFAPIRTGRLGRQGRKVLGIFKAKPRVIRTRIANALRPISHEIGHDLHGLLFPGLTPKGKLTPKTIPRKYWGELSPLAYEGAKDKVVEGYAEFVSHWLKNPAKAQELAPTFYDHFTRKLDENPNIKAELVRAQTDIQRWHAQPDRAKVLSTISVEEPTPKRPYTVDKFLARWENRWQYLKTAVGEMTGGNRLPATKDPYKQAWLLNGVAGRAETWLQRGVTNAEGRIIDLSFDQIMAPVSGELADDFLIYSMSVQAVDALNQDKIMPLERSVYEGAIQSYDQETRSLFDETLDNWVRFQDHALQELVDSGLLSAEGKQAMREKYPHHIPLYRVMDKVGFRGPGRMVGDMPSVIKRFKGSGRDILDPREGTVRDVYMYLHLAQMNRVWTNLAKLADDVGQQGRWVERVPLKMMPVANVSLGEVLGKHMGADSPITIEDLEEIATTIFRPQFRGEPQSNIILFYEKGQPALLQLDQDFYDTVTSMDSASANIFISLMHGATRALRTGALTTPEFLVREPVRDLLDAMIYSEAGIKPHDYFRGIFHVLGKTDLYYQWKAGGGAHAALVSPDRKSLQQYLRRMHQGNVRGLLDFVYHPFDSLRAILEAADASPRFAEFAKSTRWGAETDLDKIQDSILGSRDLTLDFLRSGTVGRKVNQIAAFWNAPVQGASKAVRAFKAQPTRTTLRAMAYITIPTMLLYMLNRKDERYRKLPDWLKDACWIIPTPWFLIPIPRAHLLGILFGAVPERIMRYVDQEDPYAFDNLAKSLYGELPEVIPIPNLIRPLVEILWNKSYSGAKIVPEREKGLPPKYQAGPRTTSAAKLLGRMLGLSPRQIDHAIRGHFGGLGRYAAEAASKVLEATGIEKRPARPSKTLADVPGVRAYVVNPLTPSVDIDRLYQERDDLGRRSKAAKLGGPALSSKEQRRLNALNSAATKLSDLRKEARAVEDGGLSPATKRSRLQDFRKKEDRLAAEVMRSGSASSSVSREAPRLPRRPTKRTLGIPTRGSIRSGR